MDADVSRYTRRELLSDALRASLVSVAGIKLPDMSSTEPPLTGDDPTSLSATALAAAIRERRLSSEEVVAAHLRRIDAVNPRLNAVFQLRHEGALADARAADRAPRAGRGALHGVPFTIKDTIDTAGVVTTLGLKGLASYAPTEDATVVKRLRRAGGILLGKTNVPELALSYETNNLVYGRTNNPYDLERTPGGSSGGAAAIVAAHGVPFDIGSDAGGSVRIPAHFCGIAAIKPTTGRVPRTGHEFGPEGPFQAIWQLGPLARTVDDLAALLAIISGPDDRDSYIAPVPLGDHRSVRLRGLRVAHFTNLGPLQPTAETAAAVERAVATLARAGATVRQVEVPEPEKILQTELDMLIGAAPSLVKFYEQWHTSEGLLLDGFRSMPAMSASTYFDRLSEWDLMRGRMLHWLADYDAILCPACAEPAPKHGSLRVEGMAYSILFNLTGWPSTVVRAGTSGEGLPIGVQCVARPWREDVSLAVARYLETAFGPWAGPALEKTT